MQMNGNAILITGGGSGIGRGLAEAFHAMRNQVIIAGRRQAVLDEVTEANPGMKSAMLDLENGESIPSFAARLERDHPSLNVVIHSAGIMRAESLLEGRIADAQATVAINLLGTIRLTAALLPGFKKKPLSTIVTVSSGLAFMPLAMTPTYCATKAAVHSYSQSLRYQLRDTSVGVIEIVPPYVQTELMGPDQAHDAKAMPLKDFIKETLELLAVNPSLPEICVDKVVPLRTAESSGTFRRHLPTN